MTDEQQNKFDTLMRSKAIKHIALIVGVAALFLIVFQAGVYVGYHKAAGAFRGGDNYYRAFDKERRGPIPGMMREEFPGANGATGKILSIDLPKIVIENRDATERSITLSSDTIVRKGRENIDPKDLHVDDMIVVIGAPVSDTDPSVAAKLIRLLPPPSGTTTQVVPNPGEYDINTSR